MSATWQEKADAFIREVGGSRGEEMRAIVTDIQAEVEGLKATITQQARAIGRMIDSETRMEFAKERKVWKDRERDLLKQVDEHSTARGDLVRALCGVLDAISPILDKEKRRR